MIVTDQESALLSSFGFVLRSECNLGVRIYSAGEVILWLSEVSADWKLRYGEWHRYRRVALKWALYDSYCELQTV